MAQHTVLIVDDEQDSLEICTRVLRANYDVITTNSTEEAFEFLSDKSIDCIVTDLVMPQVNGLEFVEKLRDAHPEVPILVMSGKATLKMAVQAMKSGAIEFIEKPILDLEILQVQVEKAISSHDIIEENKRLRMKLSANLLRSDFVGNSREIQKMLEVVHKVSALNSTIMLEGETGTGKEMIARMIHENSNRSEKPFVAVNCGAVPETLLESLLFGHTKGAFTDAHKESKGYFVEANRGTLFLDEIGETEPTFQVKLLRVLQEKTIRRVGSDQEISVDVRIIAATNRNLEEEMNRGSFRKDLYYRLNVIKITVPPLRERVEDIPLLARHFLKLFMKENGLSGYELTRDTLELLKKAPWEGNIRELQNVIEHSAALCSEQTIKADDLPEYLTADRKPQTAQDFSDNYEEAKAEFEYIYFQKLLALAENSVTEAAKISGLSRQHIYLKMKQLGLENN